MKRYLTMSATLLAALALGAGCDERDNAATTTPADAITPADATPPGAAAEVAKTPVKEARLVTLGGAITELVVALGHEQEIVAVDTSSTWPESLKDAPRVGYFRQLSAEGILALHPTAILATHEAGPPEVLAQLEAAGVTITRLEGGDDAASARTRALAVGAHLGRTAEAEQLVAKMDAALKQVEAAKHAHTGEPPRALFIYARGANMVMVSGEGTPAHQMLTLAGAQSAVTGFEGFKPLSPEVVASSQPDFLVIPQKSALSLGGVDAVLALPGVSHTEAAKTRRVVMVDDLKLLGFGPRYPEALGELQAGLGITPSSPPSSPAATDEPR